MPGTGVNALFVYGTLRAGECRHALLRNVQSIRPARAPGVLLDCGDYPAMRPLQAGESGFVAGELVEIENLDGLLAELDAVEGYRGPGQPGSLFRRELIEVQVEGGPARTAWVYWGEDAITPDCPVIAGGDWKDRRSQAPG